MTTYTVQGPSGKSYTIDGPEGATSDQLGQAILANSHEERVASEYARGKAEYNPTNDMGTGDRLLSGIGRGYASVGRGLAQARDSLLPDGSSTAGKAARTLLGVMPGGAALGALPGTSQADVEQAKRNDAPLLATRAGKVGNVIGTVAATAPAALVPGANTYAGAAAIGGLTGALATEGGLKDRAAGAAGGVVGGVVGQGAGNLIGKGVAALGARNEAKLAVQQAANTTKDAAIIGAQDAGYAITPSMSGKPGLIGSLAEGLGGKIKTQQAASVKNQTVTNNLVAKDLGLPEGSAITPEALDELRKTAGGAYADVAGLGKFDAAGAKLPGLANVKNRYDKLTLTPKSEVDAKDLVSAWKQSNADATAYYRQYGRDANPETLAKAKAAASDAKAVDDFLTTQVGKREAKTPDKLIADLSAGRISREEFISDSLRAALKKGGQDSLVDALKKARVQIAKTYTAEKALNPATGDIVASKLAAQQAKGRLLSGGMKDAADFAATFPMAAQAGKDVPRYSILDMLAAGHAGGPAGLAIPLVRPMARSAALSGPVQRGLQPTYQPNALLKGGASALRDPRVQALEAILGADVGSNLIGSYARQ